MSGSAAPRLPSTGRQERRRRSFERGHRGKGARAGRWGRRFSLRILRCTHLEIKVSSGLMVVRVCVCVPHAPITWVSWLTHTSFALCV
eukprot:1388963-Prymnesium_polylepis.1